MKQEEQIIRTEYSELMQKSYIDYAMSVIISRALPDIRDGLKPVQRRTLYDMYELGIRYVIRYVVNHKGLGFRCSFIKTLGCNSKYSRLIKTIHIYCIAKTLIDRMDTINHRAGK